MSELKNLLQDSIGSGEPSPREEEDSLLHDDDGTRGGRGDTGVVIPSTRVPLKTNALKKIPHKKEALPIENRDTSSGGGLERLVVVSVDSLLASNDSRGTFDSLSAQPRSGQQNPRPPVALAETKTSIITIGAESEILNSEKDKATGKEKGLRQRPMSALRSKVPDHSRFMPEFETGGYILDERKKGDESRFWMQRFKKDDSVWQRVTSDSPIPEWRVSTLVGMSPDSSEQRASKYYGTERYPPERFVDSEKNKAALKAYVKERNNAALCRDTEKTPAFNPAFAVVTQKEFKDLKDIQDGYLSWTRQPDGVGVLSRGKEKGEIIKSFDKKLRTFLRPCDSTPKTKSSGLLDDTNIKASNQAPKQSQESSKANGVKKFPFLRRTSERVLAMQTVRFEIGNEAPEREEDTPERAGDVDNDNASVSSHTSDGLSGAESDEFLGNVELPPGSFGTPTVVPSACEPDPEEEEWKKRLGYTNDPQKSVKFAEHKRPSTSTRRKRASSAKASRIAPRPASALPFPSKTDHKENGAPVVVTMFNSESSFGRVINDTPVIRKSSASRKGVESGEGISTGIYQPDDGQLLGRHDHLSLSPNKFGLTFQTKKKKPSHNKSVLRVHKREDVQRKYEKSREIGTNTHGDRAAEVNMGRSSSPREFIRSPSKGYIADTDRPKMCTMGVDGRIYQHTLLLNQDRSAGDQHVIDSLEGMFNVAEVEHEPDAEEEKQELSSGDAVPETSTNIETLKSSLGNDGSFEQLQPDPSRLALSKPLRSNENSDWIRDPKTNQVVLRFVEVPYSRMPHFETSDVPNHDHRVASPIRTYGLPEWRDPPPRSVPWTEGQLRLARKALATSSTRGRSRSPSPTRKDTTEDEEADVHTEMKAISPKSVVRRSSSSMSVGKLERGASRRGSVVSISFSDVNEDKAESSTDKLKVENQEAPPSPARLRAIEEKRHRLVRRDMRMWKFDSNVEPDKYEKVFRKRIDAVSVVKPFVPIASSLSQRTGLDRSWIQYRSGDMSPGMAQPIVQCQHKANKLSSTIASVPSARKVPRLGVAVTTAVPLRP